MRKSVLIQISLSDKQLLKRNPPSWGFLFFISFFHNPVPDYLNNPQFTAFY